MMKIFVLLYVICILDVFSQEHQFLTPVGAYEGIAGNTGIARDKSIGSVIYNPAGLASIKSSKLSASGSAFSQNKISLKSEYVDENVEYIQTIPSQITTSFKQHSFNWAFSVIVTKSQEFDYAIDSGTPAVDKDNLDGYNKQQETLFGPSIALKPSKYFKIGLSLFVSKRDEKTKTVSYADYANYSEQNYFQADSSSIAAFPILGILITPIRGFALGLKFVGPSSQISGVVNSKVRYVGWDDSGNGPCPNGEPDGTCSLAWYSRDKKEKTTYDRPMEIGLGLSANLTRRFKILIDATNQLKKEYEVYKEDAEGNNYEISYKNSIRYNAGFEYLTSRTDAITLGFMYNPNPLENDSSGVLDLDFMGATLGYRSIDKIADSSFGFFYNQANSDKEGLKTTYNMYGLFVSTSINFMN